ncbi:MAG: alanine racemase domain protein [Clostridia bacterium]|nr:alanine racemase domain protein [Clostridia bacterium]
MQIEAGAKGITCAKVSEAEVFAEGGIEDIFIAYPMVGHFRIKRAIQLSKKIKRLILAVDSVECAQALSDAAKKADVTLEVRLEVDTGAKRTGISYSKAVECAAAVSNMPNLELTGVYTFKGLVYKDKFTTDNKLAAQEEGELLEKLAAMLKQNGINIKEISAGSTPTGVEVAKTKKVTEVRPGTYVFKDYMLCCEGVAQQEDIAAKYYVTVVSTPSEEYAVIDGGTKTFPMDITLNTAPYFYPGYALVEGNDDLLLTRLNEEHGMLTSKKGRTGLKVGQKLALIPIHICTAINMQNDVYIYDGHELVKEKVNARGMIV